MPDTPSCTPLDLSLLIAPKGDKHQITFGLIRGCDEHEKPTWTITFLLEEKDGDTWKKRVDFKLNINVEAPAKTDRAEKIADSEHLSRDQADWVTGPMYVAGVRESRASLTDARLLALLEEDAAAFEARGLVDEGEPDENLVTLLTERFARKRPGLKELSILFLDID